jgi:hypothetical protein
MATHDGASLWERGMIWLMWIAIALYLAVGAAIALQASAVVMGRSPAVYVAIFLFSPILWFAGVALLAWDSIVDLKQVGFRPRRRHLLAISRAWATVRRGGMFVRRRRGDGRQPCN